jgi:hypothetical protein
MSEKEGVVNFQFQVPESQMQTIESLMATLGIKTKKELINQALTLLNWAVMQQKKGKALGVADREVGTFQELLMPGWDRLSEKKGEGESRIPKENSASHNSGAWKTQGKIY